MSGLGRGILLGALVIFSTFLISHPLKVSNKINNMDTFGPIIYAPDKRNDQDNQKHQATSAPAQEINNDKGDKGGKNLASTMPLVEASMSTKIGQIKPTPALFLSLVLIILGALIYPRLTLLKFCN